MAWLPTRIKLVHYQRNIFLLIFFPCVCVCVCVSLSLSLSLISAWWTPRCYLQIDAQMSSTNAICCWSSTLCHRNLKCFRSRGSWRFKWTFYPLLCFPSASVGQLICGVFIRSIWRSHFMLSQIEMGALLENLSMGTFWTQFFIRLPKCDQNVTKNLVTFWATFGHV